MDYVIAKTFLSPVEVPGQVPTPPMEVPFEITHETLEYAPKRYGRLRRLRPFRVTGRLHDAAISTSRPLTGEVVVEESECPIKVEVTWRRTSDSYLEYFEIKGFFCRRRRLDRTAVTKNLEEIHFPPVCISFFIPTQFVHFLSINL